MARETTVAVQLLDRATRLEAQAARCRAAAGLLAAADPPRPESRSTAVALAVLNRDGRRWTAPELAEAMLRDGWETGSTDVTTTVRTVLARLVRQGRAHRVRDGVFTRIESGM